MIKVNVAEAKANLSRYLNRVEAGEVIVLCRRNVAIAELRAVSMPAKHSRKVGAGRELFGEWAAPASFDDPLPGWLLDAFEDNGP